MAFKDSLRRARKKKGLTQSDMAKLTGLKVSTISMYEMVIESRILKL